MYENTSLYKKCSIFVHTNSICTRENKEQLIKAHGNGIMLNVKELPMYSYGAYLYNDGKFPYFLNPIKTIHIAFDGDELELQVTDVTTKPTNRFRFDDELKQSVADSDGLGCMWQIIYHLKL